MEEHEVELMMRTKKKVDPAQDYAQANYDSRVKKKMK
jgi:hypothetical protein